MHQNWINVTISLSGWIIEYGICWYPCWDFVQCKFSGLFLVVIIFFLPHPSDIFNLFHINTHSTPCTHILIGHKKKTYPITCTSIHRSHNVLGGKAKTDGWVGTLVFISLVAGFGWVEQHMDSLTNLTEGTKRKLSTLGTFGELYIRILSLWKAESTGREHVARRWHWLLACSNACFPRHPFVCLSVKETEQKGEGGSSHMVSVS